MVFLCILYIKKKKKYEFRQNKKISWSRYLFFALDGLIIFYKFHIFISFYLIWILCTVKLSRKKSSQ